MPNTCRTRTAMVQSKSRLCRPVPQSAVDWTSPSGGESAAEPSLPNTSRCPSRRRASAARPCRLLSCSQQYSRGRLEHRRYPTAADVLTRNTAPGRNAKIGGPRTPRTPAVTAGLVLGFPSWPIATRSGWECRHDVGPELQIPRLVHDSNGTASPTDDRGTGCIARGCVGRNRLLVALMDGLNGVANRNSGSSPSHRF
jgi:hypothetical protein